MEVVAIMSNPDKNQRRAEKEKKAAVKAAAKSRLDEQKKMARQGRTSETVSERVARAAGAGGATNYGGNVPSVESPVAGNPVAGQPPQQQTPQPPLSSGAPTQIQQPVATRGPLPQQATTKKPARKPKNKGVQRSIRPIRSRSQQNLARLAWSLFGLALVLVSVAGFWVVLINTEEDPETIEVLNAARNLVGGDRLVAEDLGITVLNVEEEIGQFIPASAALDLEGRLIKDNIVAGSLVLLSMFGDTLTVPESTEIDHPLRFDNGRTAGEGLTVSVVDGEEILPGDRIVVSAVSGDGPIRYAIEVVDAVSFMEGELVVRGTHASDAWWRRTLFNYAQVENIGIEYEVVNNTVPQLCYREWFRVINGINALSKADFEALQSSLDCPAAWNYETNLGIGSQGGVNIPEGFIFPATERPGATDGGGVGGNTLSAQLERARFIESAGQTPPLELIPPDPEEELREGNGEGGDSAEGESESGTPVST